LPLQKFGLIFALLISSSDYLSAGSSGVDLFGSDLCSHLIDIFLFPVICHIFLLWGFDLGFYLGSGGLLYVRYLSIGGGSGCGRGILLCALFLFLSSASVLLLGLLLLLLLPDDHGLLLLLSDLILLVLVDVFGLDDALLDELLSEALCLVELLFLGLGDPLALFDELALLLLLYFLLGVVNLLLPLDLSLADALLFFLFLSLFLLESPLLLLKLLL